jgi:hypothetical protein
MLVKDWECAATVRLRATVDEHRDSLLGALAYPGSAEEVRSVGAAFTTHGERTTSVPPRQSANATRAGRSVERPALVVDSS